MTDYTQHCCRELGFFLKEKKVSIKYNKFFREYNIGLINNASVVQGIVFCPWCGKKLPKDLRSKWFKVLAKEYNIIIDIGDARDRKDIPKEFWTDEWWRKRGL